MDSATARFPFINQRSQTAANAYQVDPPKKSAATGVFRWTLTVGNLRQRDVLDIISPLIGLGLARSGTRQARAASSTEIESAIGHPAGVFKIRWQISPMGGHLQLVTGPHTTKQQHQGATDRQNTDGATHERSKRTRRPRSGPAE